MHWSLDGDELVGWMASILCFLSCVGAGNVRIMELE